MVYRDAPSPHTEGEGLGVRAKLSTADRCCQFALPVEVS
jgi:hypothetical protein